MFQSVGNMKLLLYLNFLCISIGYGQAIFERKASLFTIEKILLDLDYVYHIQIRNTPKDELCIRCRATGENQLEIGIQLLFPDDNTSVRVRSFLQPLFQKMDDKLGAHKELGIQCDLQIPNSKILQLKSNKASVRIEGEYLKTDIELQQGSATLSPFTGDASVKTIAGTIILHTKNATVTADSRNGTVAGFLRQSPYHIQLQSLHGDITVSEIK